MKYPVAFNIVLIIPKSKYFLDTWKSIIENDSSLELSEIDKAKCPMTHKQIEYPTPNAAIWKVILNNIHMKFIIEILNLKLVM